MNYNKLKYSLNKYSINKQINIQFNIFLYEANALLVIIISTEFLNKIYN
jgi:hypothetical protein